MRNECLALAPEILQHVLENEEDDFQLKDLDPENPGDYWEQIDGDYGDPWEYGGAWINRARHVVWYFDGVEALDTDSPHRIDPDTIPIPSEMQFKLDHRFPLNYEDPDGDEEWAEKIRRENQWKQDQAKGAYQAARAAYLELRKPRQFYEIDIDRDLLPSHVDSRAASIAQTVGQTEQEFRELPIEHQLLEAGRYLGFESIGNSFSMTRLDARKELNEPKL